MVDINIRVLHNLKDLIELYVFCYFFYLPCSLFSSYREFTFSGEFKKIYTVRDLASNDPSKLEAYKNVVKSLRKNQPDVTFQHIASLIQYRDDMVRWLRKDDANVHTEGLHASKEHHGSRQTGL